MLRLFLYFGLFSTIFCASLELDVAKPEIQSLEKASNEETLSLNELGPTTPTEKWKNSPIILRTLQLIKSVMTQNMERQAHMTYILNHLIEIIENNTDSFSLEEQNAVNELLDALENYQGPTLENHPNPDSRRTGKIIPKGLPRTKKSYCADALLKISQIAADAYNKLTSAKPDYEDSKLSNFFESLALPVAGTGEINPYVHHQQPPKDASNFIMGLHPKKTMNGNDIQYHSSNIQRTKSPSEISKRIHLAFKRPRTGFPYGLKKLSQPLYKQLKSYDITTRRTSIDTKDSTESTIFDNNKFNNGINDEITARNDDEYPFDFDEFENFEGWDSNNIVIPMSGNYYAWKLSSTESPPNYFYRFSSIANDKHNPENRNIYDSKKKIPLFSDITNLVIPDIELIWNNEHQLNDIYQTSTQAHQYYIKPWMYNDKVVTDSSKNIHQPFDYERPLAYKNATDSTLYDNRIAAKHDPLNENDKSSSIVAPSLYHVVNNRHAHGHDSDVNPFTNRHEGYISIEDLIGPDDDKFWAYDTYLWNTGIELPEIKYDVPSSQVGKLDQLFYQPTSLERDVEFIDAFPVNLIKPRESRLIYPQINDPRYFHNEDPENKIEIASTNVVFDEDESERTTTMSPNLLDELLDQDSDQWPSSQKPAQIWNYYQNPLIDTKRDYYQPYVQNPDHHLPYDRNPSGIKTNYDPKMKYSLDNHDSSANYKWLHIPADRLVVVSEYVDQNPEYNWPYYKNPSEMEVTTERHISISDLTDSKFSDIWHYNKNPGHQWPYNQNPDYYQHVHHKPITNNWPYYQLYYPSETVTELTTKKYISGDLNLNHDLPYDQNPDYNWQNYQNPDYNWLDDQKPDYDRPYDKNPSGLEIDINTNNIESSPLYNVLPMSTVRSTLVDKSHYWSFDQNPSELDMTTERFTLIDLHNDFPMPIKKNKNDVNHNPGYWPYYQNPAESKIGEIDITTESSIPVDINSRIPQIQSYDPGNYRPYYQNSHNYNQNPSDTEILEHEAEPTTYEIKWLSPTKRPFVVNNIDWFGQKNLTYKWQYDQNPNYDNNPSENEIETITTIAPINYDTNSNPAYKILPSSTVKPILIKNTSHYWSYDQSPDKFWPYDQAPSDIEIQPKPNKPQNIDYNWPFYSNPDYNGAYNYNPNYNWSYDHSPDSTYDFDPEYYWYYDHNPDSVLTYDQNPPELETEVTTKSHISIDGIMDQNVDFFRPNNHNLDLYWLYIQNPSHSETEITTKRYTIKHNINSDSIENWWSLNSIRPFDSDPNLDNYWPYGQNPTDYWPNGQNPSENAIEVTTKEYIPIDYNVGKYPTYDELLPPKWSVQIKNYLNQNPDKYRPKNQNLDYWSYIQNHQVIYSNPGTYDQNSNFYWPIDQNRSQFGVEVTTKRFVVVEHENDGSDPKFIPHQPEKPIPVEAKIDSEHSSNKPIEFETTTQNPMASSDKNSVEVDFLVTTNRPPAPVHEDLYSKKFVFDSSAWNVNRPSTIKVPQHWDYNHKQWEFNIKVPTERPSLNGYKISGNTAYIWDYNQHPETATDKYIVSNENGHLNHNYHSMYNNYWNQPLQISTEGYITLNGISGPQINQLWTSENFWKPGYGDTLEYNIESFSPGIHISTQTPNAQDNRPNISPNNPDIEGEHYFQYDSYEITTPPPKTLINSKPNPWEYDVQITTERPTIIEHEISEFENSYPKEVTNEIVIASEVTTPQSIVSSYYLDYMNDPTFNSDDASVISIEQTSTNMMTFGEKPTTSENNQLANLDYSTDILDQPSWNYDNHGNSTDFIEVPNYGDDYSEIFNTDLSDLEIDDNIETETQVINLIKQKLGEVEKKAKNENEIRILTLINKIREIISGDVNKDKYVKILTYYNEINSYLNANMNGQSKMTLIINRLYTLPNHKNLEIDNHDNFVEMTYLVRRPKPIIIYPYYYIKYKVPVHKIDELVREDPNIIDEDDNLHIDLLRNAEIAEISSALKNLTENDLVSLTIGHGDVIDTKLVSVSSNKTTDLYKDLFNRQSKKLRIGEKSLSDLNKLNGKAIQLTIQKYDKPYGTISIQDRHFPIEEQHGDQLNDLNDPFRKLLPLYKLKQATDKAYFANRRSLNLEPLDILPKHSNFFTVEPLNQVIVNTDKKTTLTEENNPSNVKNAGLSTMKTEDLYSIKIKNEEQGSVKTENDVLNSNTEEHTSITSINNIKEEHNSINTKNDALSSNVMKNEEENSGNTENDAQNSNTFENEEHNSITTKNEAHSSNTFKNEKQNSVNTENGLNSNTMKIEENDSVKSENEALNSNIMKNDERNTQSIEIEEHNSIKAESDALNSETIEIDEGDSNDEHDSSNTRLEEKNSTTAKRESYVPSDLLLQNNRNLRA